MKFGQGEGRILVIVDSKPFASYLCCEHWWAMFHIFSIKGILCFIWPDCCGLWIYCSVLHFL